MLHQKIEEIIRRDPRYTREAYEFVQDALEHTNGMLGRQPRELGSSAEAHHVSGRQLLEGIRDLALREYGLMARTVFHLWGVDSTADFGEIVFNLIEAKLMSKTDEDCREDFRDVYDLDQVLVRDFRIDFKEEVEEGT